VNLTTFCRERHEVESGLQATCDPVNVELCPEREGRSMLCSLFLLTKPRIAFFSVLPAFAVYVAAGPKWDPAGSSLTFGGILFSAAGSLAFNQWWEREPDALMPRTRDRPLPRGHLQPGTALTASIAFCLAGIALLAWNAGMVAAILALATIVVYSFLYTPLKRKTPWATEVGAVSGALPPLLGAASAGEPFSPPGILLAGIILFWQMPHFYAVGWVHREGYAAAGYRLLPAIDHSGMKTGSRALFYTGVMFLFSLWPLIFRYGEWVGAAYAIVAMIGGGCLVGMALRFRFCSENSMRRRARQLFLSTVLYLPPLLLALVADHTLLF